MALLPYMEWVRYQDLLKVFWKYIPDHHHDGPLRSILFFLHKERLIERQYSGSPPALNEHIKLSPYLYIRRIAKNLPRKAYGIDKKIDGTFGIAAEKKRARAARRGPKKPPKKSIKTLTIEDWHYIRENRYKISTRALSEMFNVHMGEIQKIHNGHKPDHLKVRPAQSLPADNPAGI